MADAEAQIRKAHKSGPGTDRLANAARLAALEKNLGVEIKRHRDPGSVVTESLSEPGQDTTKDETIFLGRES